MAFLFQRFPTIAVPVADAHVGSGFPTTQSTFNELYQEGLEKGSQLSVYVNGQLALEMHGGRNAESVFRPDQIASLYSGGKFVESIAVALLVERGLLTYDTKVAEFVPGFYDADLNVAQLMQHRAGAAAIVNPPQDWPDLQAVLSDPKATVNFINKNLSRDNPVPPTPAKRVTRYHASTRGFFVSVMVWHYANMSMEDFVQRYIVEPVQAAEANRGHDMQVQMHIGAFSPGSPAGEWMLTPAINARRSRYVGGRRCARGQVGRLRLGP